jgi:nicotinamide riboside kinase
VHGIKASSKRLLEHLTAMPTANRPQRVAILGAESTGKSWLAQALSAVLQMRGHSASTVDEVLRAWCDREGRTPQPHEQMGIARLQATAIENAFEQARAQTTPSWVIADTTPLMTAVYSHLLFDDQSLYPMALAHHALYDHTLLTGLDLPWVADGLQRDGPHVRGPVDSLLRQALARAGIAHRVVYGQGHLRLNNALLALDLSGEDEAARAMREQSQFAINQGHTAWQCNECSDPACEHKLFTGLLAKRSG